MFGVILMSSAIASMISSLVKTLLDGCFGAVKRTRELDLRLRAKMIMTPKPAAPHGSATLTARTLLSVSSLSLSVLAVSVSLVLLAEDVEGDVEGDTEGATGKTGSTGPGKVLALTNSIGLGRAVGE